MMIMIMVIMGMIMAMSMTMTMSVTLLFITSLASRTVLKWFHVCGVLC